MRIACVLFMATLACAQATYSGSGRSSGSVTYQTRGAPGGGGVLTNENLYCPPGPAPERTEQTTPTWGVSDGVALLPVRCMNTALTSTPSPGSIVAVAAADNAGFQTALNSAACGQTITLVQNSTYTGSFTLPAHGCTGAQWITIRSTGVTDPNFPAEGVRATPCIIGVTNDAVNGYNAPGYPSYAPTLVGCPILSAKVIPTGSGNLSSIITAVGADHYRFIGIEFTKAIGVQTSQLVVLNTGDKTQAGGLGANHVIFDRCIVHGEQWLPTSGPGSELQAGIDGNNAQWIAFINGWIYDIYCNSSCIDSQGFKAGTGYYQDAPLKLYNSLIASAGEAWILGGGGSGPGTAVSHDVEIRANHLFSPLTWMTPVEQTALYPNVPIKKNNGEFKTGIGVLLEANYCENNWLGNSDQDGFCFLARAGNQNSNDQVPLIGNGTTVVTVGSCTGQTGCTPNFSPDMLDATNCSPSGGCILEASGSVFRFCNGANGCDQSGTTMAAGTTCVLGTDNPLHSTCTSARIYIDPSNPTVALPNGTILAADTFACHPGKAPGAQVRDVTFRYNTGSNVINGFQISTGVSSHCRDEALGTSRVTAHDNLLVGLDINMADGSDADSSASGFIISNGQISYVMNSVDVVHNTVVVATGNIGTASGFGNQVDHTDIGYLNGLNIHDNVAPAPWLVTRSKGSILNGGLAATWQTDACRSYYPVEAPAGFVQVANTQNFTFTAIPGGLNYIVTLNGMARALTNPTTTSFTISTATVAGDAISIRDLTQCNWTFRSNLLGTGAAMLGSGKDASPYPDGTIQASANNTNACGTGLALTCLLNEGNGPVPTGAFTSNFVNWIGRGGNYNLKPTSVYFGQSSDAATRAATGKSPGADLTALGLLQQGVAAATAMPQLTITSTLLTPGATVGTAYSKALASTNGASQFWPGYKSWFLVTDPALCQGDCGALPASSGILVGRGGVVNGPFILQTVKRAVQACGSAGTVACSTLTVQQTIVAGAYQLGQVVLLSNFENGTGNAINDATFNGTCTITIVVNTNTFSCPQVGTGADTITSHSPNSFWQGVWKTATTYALNEQVLASDGTIWFSLQSNNKGHNPLGGFPYWNLATDPIFVPDARATFAPVTAGRYVWWMGVRDGAFQLAYGKIDLTVNSIVQSNADDIAPTGPTQLFENARIDQSYLGWSVCAKPGCDPGGTGTPTTTTQTINNANPSRDGAAMLFSMTSGASCVPPGCNTNVLWVDKVGVNDAVTVLTADFWVNPSAGAAQLEYDTFLFSTTANKEFMWGSQCNIATGKWQIWSQINGWIDFVPTLACSLSTNNWHHIVWNMHRVAGDTNVCSGQPCQYYDMLTIDDVQHVPTNSPQQAGPLPAGWASAVGFQFQINTATVNTTATESLDLANITAR